MRWTVHGERSLYESDWMCLRLVDVELPGGRRFEHHVLRTPAHAAGVVVHDNDRGVLLLWRHRFITDEWGWEIPAGRIDGGEAIEAAAVREAEEETGWRPRGPLRLLTTIAVASGITDHQIALFAADGADHVGEPVDVHEAERVEWLSVDAVRAALTNGEIVDGPTVAALALWLSGG
jgi:8-oxo-dGTP pyrophosphatase MutT (NUDIX family)